MSEWDIFKRLDTVKAPPDFEQRVMAQLSLRKRTERRRRAILRWSMAGSLASLAAVVLLNVFVFQARSPSGIAEKGKGIAPASSMVQEAADERTIPIIETLDYRNEMRGLSSEPETIYLLEQISDTSPRGIRY